MSLLLKNIHRLYRVANNDQLIKSGAEMSDALESKDSFVWCEVGKIKAFGPMETLPPEALQARKHIDCRDRIVFPSWVDSHTHLVFPATREKEFVDRIRGLSYEEIARRGGGILNTAAKLRAASEEELLTSAITRAWEIIRSGTATVEIKSGYGLTVEDELKMLRVAQALKRYTPLRIKTTLLGAHAYPIEYRDNKPAYVDLVINEMIPRAADENLAEYIDVFCERGFFSIEDTERILQAGAEHGLKAKIHANQLDYSGGVQAGVKNGAISVDHLECIGDAEIEVLKGSSTMPTILPSAAFFLSAPYQPARRMIDAGLPVAIASDYNPGSTPTGNMSFEVALACIRMKMLPEEALCAATINGAAALELSTETGSIDLGKAADLIISEPMDSFALIPYYFANNQVWKTVIGGVPFDAKA